MASSSAATTTTTVTCRGSSNIAVIKYWGKRDEERVLAVNGSVSVTLDADDMGTTTTVSISAAYESDRIWLNGKEENAGAPRIRNCLSALRARTGIAHHVHIVSENNFPTAAGLASSASGYATLVYCLAQAFGFKESYPNELSTIARVGSGSACRSIYGGFVRWNLGKNDDGSDSTAEQLLDEKHWPELEILVCVVSDHEKDVSSTSGMQTSVKTSELLRFRAAEVVEPRLKAIEEAYKQKDFATFGKITMQDSNQFHAVCQDTYPPIFYMNDTSRAIVSLVHRFNDAAGQVVAAYTFDAGPNAVLFTTTPHLTSLLGTLLHVLPKEDHVSFNEYVHGSKLLLRTGHPDTSTLILSCTNALPTARPCVAGSIKRIMHTTVSAGPTVLAEEASLIDVATGLPKTSK